MKINDSPIARWTMLIIVATAMMMGYFVNDVMSPLEPLLEAPVSEGGLGWSSSTYGIFSGAGSFINVFLLMLFFSGIILDKMGIRFTGTLACSLMVIGTLIKYYGITHDFGPSADDSFQILSYAIPLPPSAIYASLGFAIFGVGYEMTGITVSKAMVRWFTGHELALAMGIQLSMARLGTAAALSVSAPIAHHYSLSSPLLLALSFLIIGLLAFLVFCVMDRRLDESETNSSSVSKEFQWSDIGTILRNPGFWVITIFVVLFYSSVSPFLKFATKLLIVKYGVDANLAGLFTSIAPFGTMLFTPIFGSFYDRRGKGITLVIIGTAMLALVHFGFSLPIHNSFFALTLIVILAIGYSLAPAALWPTIPKIIPLHCLGTAYSLIFFIQNFGRTIIPMLVGRANENDPTYTSGMLIFAFTALFAVGVAACLFIVDRKKGYGLQLPSIRK